MFGVQVQLDICPQMGVYSLVNGDITGVHEKHKDAIGVIVLIAICRVVLGEICIDKNKALKV